MSDWGLLTNHGRALLCLAQDPSGRVRDVAACLGITERAAQRIVTSLCEQGYLEKEREGRRNRYRLRRDRPMSDPLVEGRPVGDLAALVLDKRRSASAR